MSTTFGIKIKKDDRNVVKPVAYRYGAENGKARIQWEDPLYALIKPDTLVVAVDNTPQGIETIGDLLNHR